MPPQTTSPSLSAVRKPWFLRIISILYGLLILPGIFVALSAVFIFDSPESGGITATLFASSLGIVPLTLLVSCIGGLVCAFGNSSSRKIFLGKIFAWLPIVNVLLILLAIGSVQLFCGGSFVCGA